MTKQAVIYCRISEDKSETEDGGGRKAVERQERECREWAEKNEFTVTAVYVDNSISATKGRRRPAFEKMIEASPPAIIAWHQDRIVRLTKELERLIKLDIPIYTVQAGMLDLSTAQGRAVARTVAAWSTYEGEHKASRQNSAITEFFDAGEPVPGKRRFGFLGADKSVLRRVNTVEHPDEAKVVRWLFDSFLGSDSDQPVSIRTLAATLGWRHLRVRQTLSNPAYAGFVVRRGEVRPAAKHVDRIVEPEVFEAAQARLASHKAAHHVGGVIKHLASGIARCGICGGPLQYRNSYLCLSDLSHPSIKKEYLEEKLRKEVVAALIFAPASSLPESSRLHAIEARLVVLASNEAELAEALAGGMSWSAIKPKQAAIASEREELERERTGLVAQSVQAQMLDSLRNEIFDVQTKRASIEKTVELKALLAERFDGLDMEQRRELVRGHLDIRVNPGRGPSRITVTHLVATSLNYEYELTA